MSYFTHLKYKILQFLIPTLLLFSFLSYQSVNAQYVENDLFLLGLMDSVSSVREFKYSISTEVKSSDRTLVSSDQYYTFDINGNIIEVLIYQKGRLYSSQKYDYDKNGRKTGYQEFDAQDRLHLTVEYKYNESGRIVSEKFDRSNQKMYDDRRKEIDVEYYKYYKNLFTTINYKYNIKNLVISKEYLKPDSSLSYRNEFDYNYKDFLVSKSHFNEIDKLSWQEKITNDLLGNPVKKKKFQNHRVVSETLIEYEFDRYKNWINRIETTENLNNIFGDEASQTSATSIREIEYNKTTKE